MKFYDPLYGELVIPEQYQPIVNSRFFRRLQYLRQLGLCYLSFPGGNHTRFEHSLGTFALASRVAKSIEDSTVGVRPNREQLAHTIRAAALCHDIGHGPFSHMSENVLLGLGAHISHERVGAHIIERRMHSEFTQLHELGVSARSVASVIRKDGHAEPPYKHREAVEAVVSGDLDVDRIDYLQRDSHYSGVGRLNLTHTGLLERTWKLGLIADRYTLELTEDGVDFVERLLFLRRNNYRRIVFESRHMAATGMFEKAIAAAYRDGESFGESVSAVLDVTGTERELKDEEFQSLWTLYGQLDYETLRVLQQAGSEAQYLIRRIRRGQLFDSVARYHWRGLH